MQRPSMQVWMAPPWRPVMEKRDPYANEDERRQQNTGACHGTPPGRNDRIIGDAQNSVQRPGTGTGNCPFSSALTGAGLSADKSSR